MAKLFLIVQNRCSSFVRVRELPLLIAVLMACGTFIWGYLHYEGVPGNDANYPLGWWGWADQGRYIEASRNYWSLPIRAGEQFYPPLYPALGAVFLPLSELHSYLPIDLALYLIYVIAFMVAFGDVIGRWLSLVALVIGLFQYKILTLQWVIPWTSTLSAALGMSAFLLFQRFVKRRADANWTLGSRTLNGALCGLLVGLAAPTRPGDFIAFNAVLFAYAGLTLYDWIAGPTYAGRKGLVALISAAVAALLPLTSYLSFNAVLFGDPMGGYLAIPNTLGGFVPDKTLANAYSHILDAVTYFAERKADWLSVVPPLVLGLCCLPFALAFGPALFRVAACAVVLNMFLVYSYADAVPTGQFRYFNIHYFKWMYPVLIAFLLYPIQGLFLNTGASRRWALASVISSFFLFCLLASVRPVYQAHAPTRIMIEGPDTLKLDYDSPVLIDFIDLVGIEAVIGNYDAFAQGLQIGDMVPLKAVRDFRLTPRPGGIRFLLTKASRIESVTLRIVGLGDLTKAANLQGPAVSVSFKLQVPWSRKAIAPELPPTQVLFGDIYSAAKNGSGSRYLEDGWSNEEPWGRWLDGSQATIRFRLPQGSSETTQLTLHGQAFIVPKKQPSVQLDVVARGVVLMTIEMKNAGEQTFRIPLPMSARGSDGTVRLELRPRMTVSPKQVGMNSDKRQLSFGLIKFDVSP